MDTAQGCRSKKVGWGGVWRQGVAGQNFFEDRLGYPANSMNF